MLKIKLLNYIKQLDVKMKIQKKVIVFQEINNALPSVLDVLSSIFTQNANILFSNGSIIEKGENLNIIGVFNKGKDNINKDKIPSGILSNCMDFGKEENLKYTKNYLIDNAKKSESKELKDNDYFNKQFKKAKKSEANDFTDKFLNAKKFSLESSNETLFALNKKIY